MSRALTPGSHGAGHTARDLDHKSSRELSGGRPMGIQLGSKIHLFYNCPPDVFMDPRIRRAGGSGEGRGNSKHSGFPPPPLRANHCRKMRETTHSERFLQKQAPELMSATCTTQALAVFKTWPENRVGPAGDKAGSSHLSTARPGSGLPAAASNGPPPTQHTGSRTTRQKADRHPESLPETGEVWGTLAVPAFSSGG